MSMTSVFRALLLGCCALLCVEAADAASGGSATTPGASLNAGTTLIYAGQAATLTAKFPGAPNGTVVSFHDGSAVIATAPLSNGAATGNVRLLIAGAHTLTATAPVTGSTALLTSPALSQTVLLSASSTALSVAANPVAFGQPSKLTANVTGVIPAGQVAFREGTTLLGTANVVAGSATISYTFTSAGAHAVQALYAGDANNAASTSATVTQTIAPAVTTTAISSSAAATTVGTTVTLKASVNGGVTSGTVSFFDGTTLLGTATVTPGTATTAASASLPVSFGSAGSHSLTASYGGTSNTKASTSTALVETVALGASATSLGSSLNPAPLGRAVQLTAKVSATNASGAVTFKDGTVILGSANLVNGAASLSPVFTALGTHTLTATYGGSSSVAASQSAPLGEVVVISPSTVTLASSASSLPLGQPLKLSVTVTGWNPSGSVKFLDGTTTLGTATLGTATSTGVATASLTTALASVGTHAITASYGGNASNAVGVSPTVNVAATAAASTTTLSASSTAISPGQSITFSVRVSSASTTAPTGSVTLKTASATVGTTSLVNGTASFPVTFQTAGSYSLVATYAGNTSNTASTSSSVSVTVGSSAPKPPATGNGINYNGGPVLSGGTNLYYIWYGNWGTSVIPGILTKFGQGIGGSGYFHINTTYSDSSGKAVGDNVTLMPSINDNYSKGTTLDDNGVFSVVSNAISSGKLPLDANGVYFVLSSADVNESSGFCTQYCGWHSSASVNGTQVRFSFIGNPDRCPSACAPGSHTANGSASGDYMASVLAHELSETVSDPDLNAWFDASGNENGDKCAWNFGTLSTDAKGNQYNITLPTGNFLIQQMWLNAQGGRCTLSYP